MPIGTVIGLPLSKGILVGTLGKLYESIENLSETYLQSVLNKEILLNPKVITTNAGTVTPLLLLKETSSPFIFMSLMIQKPFCPQCNKVMSKPMTYVAAQAAAQGGSSSSGEGWYVKGVVTYMVMDDLEVKPISTISSITMLNSFNVKEIDDLEEKKMVSVGMDEGISDFKVICIV